MFKITLKFILCYLMVLPNTVFGQNIKLSFDDFNQARLNAQSTSGLYLVGQRKPIVKIVNEYRLLGFKNYSIFELNELNRAIQTRVVVLDSNFKISEIQFSDPMQRAEIFRQYRGVFATLQVLRYTTFEHFESRSKHYKSIVKNQFSHIEDIGLRNERIQLEINKRILDELPPKQKKEVLIRTNEAKKALATPRARASFNIRAGLSVSGALPRNIMNFNPKTIYNHLKGSVSIPVKDQFGRRTTVTLPQDPRVIENERASNIVKESMSGHLKTIGLMGAAIVSFLFLSSMIKMHRDFESNPREFERTLEQTLGVAMPLSIGSFFIGGAASQALLGGDLNAYRRSLAHMQHLIKQESLGHITPEMKSKITRSYMSTMNPRSIIARALSYRGLAGGLLISKFVFLAADKLQSCLRLADYYGLTDDNRPAYRVKQLQQSCDSAWSQIWSQVMKNPQTYMEIVALLSTKTIMTLTMTGAQALNYGVLKNKADRAAAKQAAHKATMNRMSVVSRGLRSPVVKVIGGFAAFFLIFHTVLWGLDEAYQHLSVNMPAVNVRKSLAEMFNDLRDRGWDMKTLCKDYDFEESFLKRTWHSIWDWNKDQTCGVQLTKDYINYHNKIQDEWRSNLLTPFEEAVAQWQEYSHKMLNGYNATYIFYKDIADQVRVKRQRVKGKKDSPPNFKLNPKEQWFYYNDPLPLFRSDPYFGLNYRLDDSESGAIAYPIWNGIGADWDKRAQDSHGKDSLEARLNNFQNVVVPELIEEMERHKPLIVPSSLTNRPASQRQKIANEIIRDLSTRQIKKTRQTNKIVQGLQKLSDALSTDANFCQSHYSNESIKINKNYGDCYFHLVQTKFLDNEIWKSDEESHTFKPNNYGAYSKRMKTSTFRSYQYKSHYGVMPLGIGQRFFIDYYQKFDNKNVDTGYFPNDYVSLTDYLSYNLVCGPEKFEKNWTFLGSFSSPDFSPIRPEYDTDVSHFCNNTNAYIKFDSKLRYNNLPSLLYNSLSDEFVNDFDGWWKNKVLPQFKENFEFLYEEYFLKKLVQSELGNILYDSNYVSTCSNENSFCGEYSQSNKDSFKSSILQEMDLYFSNVFDPMIKTFPLDLNYTKKYKSSLNKDIARAREDLSREYNKIRSDIYAIVNAITSTVNVENNNFDDELSSVYNELSDEVEAHKKEAAQIEESNKEVAQIIEKSNILKLDVLYVVLAKRMYDMRIMFKSDLGSHIDKYYASSKNAINQLNLEEWQRKEALNELDDEINKMRSDKESKSHRANRVVVDYHDWPEDPLLFSPTLGEIVLPSLDRIEYLVKFFIETNQMRHLLITEGKK